MNKLCAIGIFLLVCIGSACNSRDQSQAGMQKRFVTKDDSFYFFDRSSNMCGWGWKAEGGFGPTVNWLAPCGSGLDSKIMKLENVKLDVVYLYDPNIGQCVIGHTDYEAMKFWPVPCTLVKDKLDPSARELVENSLETFESTKDRSGGLVAQQVGYTLMTFPELPLDCPR